MTEPIIRNAGNEQEVRSAGKRIKVARENFLHSLRALLEMPQGRDVLWHYLEMAKTFESVLSPQGSQVYYNVGQQDFGHRIMADILDANQDALFKMMLENKARKEKETINVPTKPQHGAGTTEAD